MTHCYFLSRDNLFSSSTCFTCNFTFTNQINEKCLLFYATVLNSSFVVDMYALAEERVFQAYSPSKNTRRKLSKHPTEHLDVGDYL